MLKELHIQNFKGWKDTGTICMAPITLFFGANSSGKSSIGQFLMLLKQTTESADTKTVFQTGDRNSAVNLGSFNEMVYGRNSENPIEFYYKWSLDEKFQAKDPLTNTIYPGDELSFNANVRQFKENTPPALDYFQYQLWDTKSEKSVFGIGLKRKQNGKTEYEVNSEEYRLTRTKGRVWSLKNAVQFYGFPDEVVNYHQNADFVKQLNLTHKHLFDLLSYLGPLRTKTERLYSWSGSAPPSVGFEGKETIAAILAAQERKIGIKHINENKISERAKGHIFAEAIIFALKSMKLVEDFSVKPISLQRKEYEVKIKANGSLDFVDLPDVGFGVSQVLPVLVQCFYAPANSIIIMEQPEIHLHPSAQSALADVMIDVINSRENGKNRNIQLIIETHSEHFLRRLQRRIAEGSLPDKSLSAYFANTTVNPAILEPLQIDEYGNIKNWPKDFFGNEMEDVIAQSKSAMEKFAAKRTTVQDIKK